MTLMPELKGAKAELHPAPFFHTPKDMNELMGRLEGLPGPERAIGSLYAMMAWNLACRYAAHNEALETDDD